MIIQLIAEVKCGNEAAFEKLTSRYLPMINSLTESFFRLVPQGFESVDDLYQEALMAFYRAATTFDCEQENVSFGLYAKICIKNRLISVLRKVRSQKKSRVSSTRKNENTRVSVFDKKELEAVSERLLTKYEKTVFSMYVDGKSYKSIALVLGKSEKSVDNALFRAKSKLRGYYHL